MTSSVRPTLLFDLSATQSLGHGEHGGGEYAKALFRTLARRADGRMAAFWKRTAPLDEELRSLASTAEIPLIGVDGFRHLPPLLARMQPRRFYSALPYHLKNLDAEGLEFVATVHGLRPMEIPADAQAWRYARTIGEFAKAQLRLMASGVYARWRAAQFVDLLRIRTTRIKVVVPSEFTRASLLSRFPWFTDDNVLVRYSPATEVTGMLSVAPLTNPEIRNRERGYILIVSGGRWVKNTYRALVAMEELYATLDERLRWPVVVTGSRPPLFPRRWQGMFLFTGSCSTEELASLYAHAGLLLYPSLNEGFGYPPVEAMSYGTPVLAAAISATPEISGTGAGYFCPTSVHDIRLRVASFLRDPQLRSTLADAAAKRFKVVSARQSRDLDLLCEMLLD